MDGVKVLDIETIPDEEEMARLADEWDPESVALGNLGSDKAREKIAAARQKYMDGLAKRCGLDPMLGRVASIAIGDCDDPEGTRDACRALPDFDGVEAALLSWAWGELRSARTVVAFNGIAFDSRWMRLRSAKHRVPATFDLTTRRYATGPLCDLMQILADWTRAEPVGDNGETAKNWHSAADWCRFFGIPSPKVDGMDGSQVWAAVQAGEWERVRTYNLGDIRAERAMYLRMRAEGLIPVDTDPGYRRTRAAAAA